MHRDVRTYFKDKWNVLDALALLFLFIGMVIRWYDSASPWGPALYALSAPLIVSRVLFFAQILPFQGPMIEASVRSGYRTYWRFLALVPSRGRCDSAQLDCADTRFAFCRNVN